MIVIGVDTHKCSHALAAVDEGTGRLRGKRQIQARDAGHLAAVRWARELDSDRVWAIEDCRHVSRRLEQALIAAGERVIRVSPRLMGASRKGEREPGKSDQIDSLAIARAVLKDGIESFPVAYLDEQAMRIRLLSDHRQDLVAERTRMQTRLRWHLMDLCPELEAKIKPRSLSRLSALERVERQLRGLPASERLTVAREELSHIRRLTRQVDALERQLEALIQAHRPWLLQETGCGPLVASVLIGRTAGARRFRSGSALARQAGVCPIPCSSGKTKTYRLNRGGDRQLNSALHTIAAVRARVDPRTKQYLARKQAEGKTKKGALRCLKRTLANHFHRLLARPPLTPAQTEPTPTAPASQRETQPIHTAPNPMICLT